MCGRFSLTDADPDRLQARFGAAIASELDLRRRYNVAPTDPVLAIRERTRRDGEHEARPERVAGLLRWGLVPHWSEGDRPGKPLINARAETVAERPAFREAFRRRRCLVPADGFYEWRSEPDGAKQPIWVHRADGEPFAFAGLWEVLRRDEAQPLYSCAIVTCAANDLNRAVHDRMPVVLEPGDEPQWLDPETGPDELAGLLEPREWSGFELREVSRLVNDVANDGPEVLEPPRETGQPQLF